MPTIIFRDHRVECDYGDNLRKVLLKSKLPLYARLSRMFHCRGRGVCGSCAVKLRGSASWPTNRENIRLSLPPHNVAAGLRLACQVQIQGDLVVERFRGIWGQRVDADLGSFDTKSEHVLKSYVARPPKPKIHRYPLKGRRRTMPFDPVTFDTHRRRTPTEASGKSNGRRTYRHARSESQCLRSDNIVYRYRLAHRLRHRR